MGRGSGHRLPALAPPRTVLPPALSVVGRDLPAAVELGEDRALIWPLRGGWVVLGHFKGALAEPAWCGWPFTQPEQSCGLCITSAAPTCPHERVGRALMADPETRRTITGAKRRLRWSRAPGIAVARRYGDRVASLIAVRTDRTSALHLTGDLGRSAVFSQGRCWVHVGRYCGATALFEETLSPNATFRLTVDPRDVCAELAARGAYLHPMRAPAAGQLAVEVRTRWEPYGDTPPTHLFHLDIDGIEVMRFKLPVGDMSVPCEMCLSRPCAHDLLVSTRAAVGTTEASRG